MRKLIFAVLVAASAFLLIQSCKKSDSGSSTGTSGSSSFDRTGMLTNISTNIIIPAYTSFQANVAALDAAVATFNTTPNAANLTALQAAFVLTYKQWQNTSVFEI